MRSRYHKGIDTIKDLLIHRSQEQRADARVEHAESRKDERSRQSSASSSNHFTAAQLLNDAQKAQDAHEEKLLEAQETLFKLFSYLCMGIFFIWWATATSHKLSSSCSGGWLGFGNLSCNMGKLSVGVVEVLCSACTPHALFALLMHTSPTSHCDLPPLPLIYTETPASHSHPPPSPHSQVLWIGLVVLGKNVRAVMVLFILTNGALLWTDFIAVNLSIMCAPPHSHRCALPTATAARSPQPPPRAPTATAGTLWGTHSGASALPPRAPTASPCYCSAMPQVPSPLPWLSVPQVGARARAPRRRPRAHRPALAL